MSKITLLKKEGTYCEMHIDTTYDMAKKLFQNLGFGHIDYVPYPDGKVPNNPIIREQPHLKGEMERPNPHYDPENPDNGEETEVIDIAENYFNCMQMAWNFAYIAYEDMLSGGVPHDIAMEVLPDTMTHVRVLIQADLIDFQDAVDTDECNAYQQMVWDALDIFESDEKVVDTATDSQ